MTGRILAEIKRTRPFCRLEEEAYLNVLRTASVLQQSTAEMLRQRDLTGAQYNLLRILRGAGEHGLTAGDIAERMITRDPDITRLIDRLEKRGLVERWRCTQDRRVVRTRLSPAGAELLEPLDQEVEALHVRQVGALGREKLETLITLLEDVRDVVRE